MTPSRSVSPGARHKPGSVYVLMALCTLWCGRLCPLLVMPPLVMSVSNAGSLAPPAHNSGSVCFGKKQLQCGGDEKSRANTFRISASGQINFNLNCHHKGLFFLPLSFGWYL